MSFSKTIALLLLLILCVSFSSALPNSDTKRSGDLCERAHSFQYNYKFAYPSSMEIGKTYDLTITFSLSGTAVTRNPYSGNVKINATGFDVSETSFNLSSSKKIKITPKQIGASINFQTSLTLDGSTSAHPGNEATYSDKFNLSKFNITDGSSIPIPKPDKNSDQNVNQNNDSNSNTNNTGNTDSTTTTDEGKQVTETTSSENGNTSTNFDILIEDASDTPWYVVRIAGIAAYILLSISILFAVIRKLKPEKFAALFRYHHEISIFALIFAFIHMINTLFDKYQWFLKIDDIFWFDFSTNIKIFISLGVIAFYLMTIVVLFSISPKIIQFIKYKNWYYLHLLTYFVYVFVLVHSFFLGTDLNMNNITDPATFLATIIFWALALLNTIFFILYVHKKIKEKKVKKSLP